MLGYGKVHLSRGFCHFLIRHSCQILFTFKELVMVNTQILDYTDSFMIEDACANILAVCKKYDKSCDIPSYRSYQATEKIDILGHCAKAIALAKGKKKVIPSFTQILALEWARHAEELAVASKKEAVRTGTASSCVAKKKHIPCASLYCKPTSKKAVSNEELTQAQGKRLQKLLVMAEQSFSTFEKPTFSKDYKDLALYPSEIKRLYEKVGKEFLPFMAKITALYKRKGATGRQAKKLAHEAWHSVNA